MPIYFKYLRMKTSRPKDFKKHSSNSLPNNTGTHHRLHRKKITNRSMRKRTTRTRKAARRTDDIRSCRFSENQIEKLSLITSRWVVRLWEVRIALDSTASPLGGRAKTGVCAPEWRLQCRPFLLTPNIPLTSSEQSTLYHVNSWERMIGLSSEPT